MFFADRQGLGDLHIARIAMRRYQPVGLVLEWLAIGLWASASSRILLRTGLSGQVPSGITSSRVECLRERFGPLKSMRLPGPPREAMEVPAHPRSAPNLAAGSSFVRWRP